MTEIQQAKGPTDPHAYVGGVERPGRPITVGRRRADRWLFRSAFVVFALLIVFVLWTSYEQGARQEELNRQDQALRCFAVNTQTFEIAIGDVVLLLQNENDDDPAMQAAKAELRAAQAELRRARDAQEPVSCPAQ